MANAKLAKALARVQEASRQAQTALRATPAKRTPAARSAVGNTSYPHRPQKQQPPSRISVRVRWMPLGRTGETTPPTRLNRNPSPTRTCPQMLSAHRTRRFPTRLRATCWKEWLQGRLPQRTRSIGNASHIHQNAEGTQTNQTSPPAWLLQLLMKPLKRTFSNSSSSSGASNSNEDAAVCRPTPLTIFFVSA